MTAIAPDSSATLVPSQIPSDIAAELRAMGRGIEQAKTSALYRGLHAHPSYDGVAVERDVPYGPAPLQRLDVLRPAVRGPDLSGGFSGPPDLERARPVLLYVHGGAFVGGDKTPPGSFCFDNVMLWAVRHGLVGVNINYRLAPQYRWPAGAEDLGLAVSWVQTTIAGFGGDPERIVVVGHSAGAVHAADYIGNPRTHGARGHGLAGAALLSGIYDLSHGMASPAYYGEDPARYAACSSLPGLVSTPLPLLLVHAELDPAPFIAQTEQLAAALAAAGRPPTLLALAGHSHISEVMAVNTDDTSLTAPLAGFLEALW